MNTSLYPEFETFQKLIASQTGGFAGWFSVVASVVVGLALIRARWSRPTSFMRTASRMAVAFGFVGSLVAAYPNSLFLAVPVGLLVGLAYYWHRSFHLSPRHALVLIAVLARIPGLAEPMWYDETFTAGVARLTFPQLLTVVNGDVHPPGWYALEWLVGRVFGYSEAAMRLPALVCGVGVVLLGYKLAVAMKWKPRTAFTAGLLLALLPAQIYYSTEARAYTALTCAVLGMLIGVVERRPLWFAVAAPAAILLHNYGYLYTAVLGLLALATDRRQVQRWIVAGVPAAAVGLAWLPFLLEQSGDIADGFWLTVTPASLLKPLQSMTVGLRIDESILLHTTGAAIGASLLTLYAGRRWLLSRRGVVWFGLVLGVPALAGAASFAWQPVYLERALLPCASALVVGWAWLLNETHSGDALAGRVVMVPALVLALLMHYAPDHGRIPIRDEIAAACRGADVIYNTSVSMAFMSAYYAPEFPQYLWPAAGDLNQSLPDDALAVLFRRADLPDVRGDVCILDFDTPMSRADERSFVYSITSGRPGRLVATNDIFAIYAHHYGRND